MEPRGPELRSAPCGGGDPGSGRGAGPAHGGHKAVPLLSLARGGYRRLPLGPVGRVRPRGGPALPVRGGSPPRGPRARGGGRLLRRDQARERAGAERLSPATTVPGHGGDRGRASGGKEGAGGAGLAGYEGDGGRGAGEGQGLPGRPGPDAPGWFGGYRAGAVADAGRHADRGGGGGTGDRPGARVGKVMRHQG